MLIGPAALAVPLVLPATANTSSDPDYRDKSLQYRETEHIRQFYAHCRY